MRCSILAASFFALAVVAQNCGPRYANRICAAGQCCSHAGWCDTSAAHCDPATCQPAFSGAGSTCRPRDSSTVVPEIDVCGSASGGVRCPGVGPGGYYYRCCSSVGHCGPKNPIQDPAAYCGAGCQAGYGDCRARSIPADPPAPRRTARAGETCGAIPNAVCAAGLCCSGSNFCGTGADYCGAANWCQPRWGRCDSTVRKAA